MINPKVLYAGSIDTTDALYPQGKAQECAFDGDPTGTPIGVADLNDRWGFQQAIMNKVGLTVSGLPDNVNTSQLLEALELLIGKGQPIAQAWSGCGFNGAIPATMFNQILYFDDKVYAFGVNSDDSRGVRASSVDGKKFIVIADDEYSHASAAASNTEMITVSYLGSVYKVFSSTDGTSWTEHPAPSGYMSMSAIIDNKWVLGNNSEVHRSDNSGATWANITPAGISGINSIRSLGDKLYVCHSTGIKVSEDAGNNWTDVDLIAQVWRDVAINSGGLMAVSDDTYKSAFLTTGGARFSQGKCGRTTPDGDLTKVIVHGDTFVASGPEGVYVSDGYGAPFVSRASQFQSVSSMAVTPGGRTLMCGSDNFLVYSG